MSPIQEESYSYDGTLDYPHIPRLPQINIIVGGVYGGEVKKYILFGLFVGEVPIPSNAGMCFGPWIGIALIPPFPCRPAFPHNPMIVWFILIIIIFIYNYYFRKYIILVQNFVGCVFEC